MLPSYASPWQSSGPFPTRHRFFPTAGEVASQSTCNARVEKNLQGDGWRKFPRVVIASKMPARTSRRVPIESEARALSLHTIPMRLLCFLRTLSLLRVNRSALPLRTPYFGPRKGVCYFLFISTYFGFQKFKFRKSTLFYF